MQRTFDYDGNPVMELTSTQSNGTTTSIMTYDGMGRLATRTATDGGNVSYTYDGVGNLLDARRQWRHDDVPLRPRQPSRLASGSERRVTTSFGYDANNNRNQTIFPGGTQMVSTYDTANRLISKHTFGPHTNATRGYGYTPSGPTHGSAVARSP